MPIDLLKNYLISFVRTAVPMVVGAVVSWLATQGITLDDNALGMLTLILQGAFGMAYYLLIRWLEQLNYRFGWLLGYAKMPVYTIPPTKE